MKAIYAKFKDNTKALARACQLAAETPDVKEDEVIAKVEGEIEEEAYQALVAERDSLKAENEKLKTENAELKPKAEKEAELSKEVEGLKAQLSAANKGRARFGAAPVKTGAPGGAKEAPAAITRAQFDALTPTQQGEHFAAGGKLTD